MDTYLVLKIGSFVSMMAGLFLLKRKTKRYSLALLFLGSGALVFGIVKLLDKKEIFSSLDGYIGITIGGAVLVLALVRLIFEIDQSKER